MSAVRAYTVNTANTGNFFLLSNIPFCQHLVHFSVTFENFACSIFAFLEQPYFSNFSWILDYVNLNKTPIYLFHDTLLNPSVKTM